MGHAAGVIGMTFADRVADDLDGLSQQLFGGDDVAPALRDLAELMEHGGAGGMARSERLPTHIEQQLPERFRAVEVAARREQRRERFECLGVVGMMFTDAGPIAFDRLPQEPFGLGGVVEMLQHVCQPRLDFGDVRVGLALDGAANFQGLTEQRFGRFRVLAAKQQLAEGGEAIGVIGVFLADGCLADFDGFADQRLGPRQILPAKHDPGELIEARGVLGMFLAERFLADFHRVLQQGFGVVELVLRGQNLGEQT